ncbi:hypothetical protein OJ997_13360 [Solirubrobacter phytolaccae]|uniref:Collagen-like protein n=1 Tax=Solirubrobacter phytolaccae TaxID=1404360 RepID=A0A9X3N880_9ACTN|nr:hypothetical protein [Solirubrobacter phytolaccae]MDA0181289.1 hypothetical protein [Solirubrobacter phytolaccae]
MRKHLSPGVVLGSIAVVLACTGSATAGVLITSGTIKDGTIQARDIKKGTISTDRLAASVRTQLAKAGTPGPAGPAGPAGTPATTVLGSAPQGAAKGEAGAAGKDGVNGKDGLSGSNPATLVAKSGDASWGAVGGGGTTPYPAASLSGGELRLQGGFDGSTPSGAIGFARAYDNVALSSLKTLSYDFRIIKRNAGNVVAPTIHITLLKANTGTTSGFTNLVFEPYMQGDFGLNQRYSLDAMSGKWWATRAAGGINQGNPATWADVIAKNPDATISAISFDNGGSSGNTTPADQFQAGVDNVLVGFGSEFTRFDFGG